MNTAKNDVGVAEQIRSVLDEGTAKLHPHVSVRLYEARCDALRHQAAPVAMLSLAGVGHLLADHLHTHYRGIVAVLALVVGAVGVQVWDNSLQAEQLAEIDSALLTDEVPPSAYTDPGFLEWLQQVSESDDISSPE